MVGYRALGLSQLAYPKIWTGPGLWTLDPGLLRLGTKPLTGQYLTQAHSHITQAVAARDSCFALIRAHQHGDMAVCMREVLARPWVGICVLLDLRLS